MVKTTTAHRIGRATTLKLEELRKSLIALVEHTEELAAKIHELESEKEIQNYRGLNFETLRNALCDVNASVEQAWIPSDLGTMGSGPWDEAEFDDFLAERGIQRYEVPHDELNGLVLGANEWSENDISKQIYGRTPKSLRVYTQELFVFGLIVGCDPYDLLDQDVINQIGMAHPAIQFILEQEFSWPWADSEDDEDDDETDWDVDTTDWSNESTLRRLGYSVRAGGNTERGRRAILQKAFEAHYLPGVETAEQVKAWGASKSARRLHAMSNFITWLVNFQGTEKPEARKKWLADLKWLKTSYYAKTMSFKWPQANTSTNTHKTQKQNEDARVVKTQTVLSPSAAWPFATGGGERQLGDEFRGRLARYRPTHALGVIIGEEPRIFEENAFSAVMQYVQEKRLQETTSGFVHCDAKLFALTGEKLLHEEKLRAIVKRNLNYG